MYCPGCGSELAQAETGCPRCGRSPLELTAPPGAPAATGARRSKTLIGVLVAGAILLLAILPLTVSLVGVAEKTHREAALQDAPVEQDFGITVANLSGQTLPKVDIKLSYPEGDTETTCHLTNVQPDEHLVRKIYAPPGSTLHVKVTLANGATNEGERTLAQGTQGGLRINVHAQGELGLE